MPIPFTFDRETHICRDKKTGRFIPTVSQILELNHLSFDFSKLPDHVNLDRRSKIGTEVHDLTDSYDKYRSIDPTWLSLDTAGYVESYIGGCALAKFVPRQWSTRRCESIQGMPLSGETDKEGLLGRQEAIVDLKTGSSKSDSWGFQLAPYEMLKFQSPKVGRVVRCVMWLKPDGSPGELIEYGEFSKVDGVSYADTFLAALHNTYVAIRRGYLTEKDLLKESSLQTV